MTLLRDEKKRLSPMLATLSKTIPEGGEWIFEKKYDGYRALASVKKNKVELWSRNGVSFLKPFPSLVKALSHMPQDAIFDGEAVVEDQHGRPLFSLLKKGEPLPSGFTLTYYTFDLIALDGHDLREFGLAQRKELLLLLLAKVNSPQLVNSPLLIGSREDVLENAERLGWEGVMAKELGSRYLSGRRSALWRKIKFQQSQEAIIIGYTQSENNRNGFGALVLAIQGKDGLEYIGNCGSGFTEDDLEEISCLMFPLETVDKPFPITVKVANERAVTWIKPKLIAEVSFFEWTPDGKMRHPVFKGLRDDKPLDSIEKEKELP